MELAARVDPGQLDAVVLSHVHVDHTSDLFGLYGYLAFGPSGRVPVPVYVTDGASDLFAGFARATGDHVFHHVLDFNEVGSGDETTIGTVAVRFGSSKHAVPNNIGRFEVEGRVLVLLG